MNRQDSSSRLATPGLIAMALSLLLALGGPLKAGPLPGFRPGAPTIGIELEAGFDLAADEEFSVAGENLGSTPRRIIVRIDDASSVNYATRYDVERMAAPGPFRIRLAAGQMKTPSDRFLDRSALRRVIVSVDGPSGAIRVLDLSVSRGFALPPGTHGFDLGPPGQAVFPGFEAIGPGDPRLSGAQITAVRRPSGDALVADGLRGVERFETALPNGRWTVSLWTQDQGEWEFLPHALNRRIRVNGRTVDEWRLAPAEWVRSVYLAGYDVETLQDPWEAFGRRRSGLITVEVDVSDGRLVVEMAGDSNQATYLAGLLAETTGGAAVASVETERRKRFLETWPVIGPAVPPPPPALLSGVLAEDEPLGPDWRPSARSAPVRVVPRGGLIAVDVVFVPPADDPAPGLEIESPVSPAGVLPIEARWGQWRFTRPDPALGGVVPSADHLRGDLATLRLSAGVPRRINLLLTVPPEARPGRYRGAVRLRSRGAVAEQVYEIEVLPLELPAPTRPVGVYLESSPIFDWFPDQEDARKAALSCQLEELHRLGLSGVAPPVATPHPGNVRQTIDDLALVRQAGFKLPLLAYAPVKRSLRDDGLQGLTTALAETAKGLRAAGLPTPLWSIADEPGNPGSTAEDLGRIRDAIRRADPSARIAGHLNHREDRALLPLFDVVLVNAGFGLLAEDLAAIGRRGPQVWLYNMPDMQLASGLWLWRAGGAGYLQWHAMAPTADPYDPTDGREGDVMLLPTSPLACPSVPDLDARLLRLARGHDDLRWLAWAEEVARRDERATAVLDSIRRAVPAAWPHGTIPQVDLGAIRTALAGLSRQLADPRATGPGGQP